MPQGKRADAAHPQPGRTGRALRNPNAAGATGRVARRTKLGDDGNLMQADGNSFPVFSLGWTFGAIGV